MDFIDNLFGSIRARVLGYGSSSDKKYARLTWNKPQDVRDLLIASAKEIDGFSKGKDKASLWDADQRILGYQGRRKWARDWERHAKDDGIGETEAGRRYAMAGKNWIAAQQPGKAAKDYRLAAESYDSVGHRGIAKKLTRRAERLEKVASGQWKGMTGSRTYASFGIIFLAGSILFSSGITGYVIGNPDSFSKNYMGFILFIIGLIFFFLYLRK